MTKGGVMVLDSSACFWLETIDDAGERHWSYCGNLGYVPAVRAWCEAKGIKLVDMAWQKYVRKMPASLCQP
jgi:hypothetical protein